MSEEYATSKVEKLCLLNQRMLICSACRLCENRVNAVPGAGDFDAEIMFIGEAPGAQEDLRGEPFVGRSGVVLNGQLKNIGLRREDVFITNIVKCRPPDNREPVNDEKSICVNNFLRPQIKLIEPKIIVTLGRHSTREIFWQMNMRVNSVTKMSGLKVPVKLFERDITLVPMIHPAATLYRPLNGELLTRSFNSLKELMKDVGC